jgi:hypothetical protein
MQAGVTSGLWAGTDDVAMSAYLKLPTAGMRDFVTAALVNG